MKYLFLIFTFFMIISCGGGGSVAAPNSDSSNQATTINFSGTGGDFQAAQPIDID